MATEPEQGKPDTKPSARWAVPGVLVTVVIWGSYFPVVEALLRGWEPLTLTGVRAILAGATLVALLVTMEGRGALHVGVPWSRVWALGSIGVAGNMTLITLGIQVSGAVPAALIAGTTPALAAIMARFLLGQALTGDLWIAVFLAVVGVAVVVLGGPSWQAGFGGGELLVLFAYGLWLWYLFMAQRWLPGMSQLR
ncbi:MAG: EamA family transporter, partial [Alphaproteobacteria bacterium]